MQTVIGAFDDTATAQRAVERLVQSGFDRDDVHVQQGQPSTIGQGSTTTETHPEEKHGIMAFFARLFGTDGDDSYSTHAGTYSEAVRRGSSVVVVDAKDETEADRASSLLSELGAIDVDERAQQWRTQGWNAPAAGTRPQQDTLAARTANTDTMRTPQAARAAGAAQAGDERVLDVVQEELRVGKRSLDRGGVRVVERVSQKPVRELIQLREEHAVVDRRPVDRPADAQDLSNVREGAMEIRETAEEAVVSKTARVVEEVRVGKEVRDREETIEDNLRRKDVDVERLEGQGGRTVQGERERAVASDPAQAPLTGRDPDAAARKTGDLTGKDKPGRG